MEYTGYPPENQNLSPPVRSIPGKDTLSLALNVLSQQLERIELTLIMIAPELFWSPNQTTQPYWPRITSFELVYTAATPSGQWLFEKDPRWRDVTPNESAYGDSSSDDSDAEEVAPQDSNPTLFRSKPLDILNDLYVAAGHATRQMPQLKSMKLGASIDTDRGLDHVIERLPVHGFEYDRPSGKATWVSTSEFHVTEEMREVWDAVAKSHGHGQVTIEVRLS